MTDAERAIAEGAPFKPRYQPDNCPHCEYDRRFPETADGGWVYMGNNGPDGSYWQFWFGAKNRRSHVEFRHTEMVPAQNGTTPGNGNG